MKCSRILSLTGASLSLVIGYCAKSQAQTPINLQKQQRLVMRLPHRAEQIVDASTTKGVASYWTQGEEPAAFRGKILCTDVQGRMYVYDPATPQQQWIRVVNQRGQTLHVLRLPPNIHVEQVRATPQGFVWIIANGRNMTSGRVALLVGDVRHNRIISDWRQKPPFDIFRFVQNTLGEKNLQELTPRQQEEALFWAPRFVGSADGKVMVQLDNGGTGFSPGQTTASAPPLTIRLTLSEDGKRLLKRQVIRQAVPDHTVQLAPSNTLWNLDSDFSLDTWRWSQMWLWKQGQPKGQPLLTLKDLLRPGNWWQKTLRFQVKQSNPGIRLDGRNNIYLNFERVNDRTNYQEGAVAILNPKKQILGYLPWMQPYDLRDKWLFPLADGSGFYRQEEDEKELRIYFHPLPRPKLSKSHR